MSDISTEMQRTLSARAQEFYPNVLPYHNWDHAVDVMTAAADLADRSINPQIKAKRNLLVVAAAWHDVDYAVEDLGRYQTKEERSADLAIRLLPELSDDNRELLASGILDTTVAKHPKDSLFGEVLHAADLGYFAAPQAHFMGRLGLMREEWGSPTWRTTVERTIAFGHVVLEEAEVLMPKVLCQADADLWAGHIKANLASLQADFDAGILQD